MKNFFPSIAFRLTIWFLLLSLLSLGVMAVFVRRNVHEAFDQAALQNRQQQAQHFASQEEQWAQDPARLAEFVSLTGLAEGEHFILQPDATVAFASRPEMVGSLLRQRYPVETLAQMFQSPSGAFIDETRQFAVGYARIPGTDWVDVVEMPLDIFDQPMNQLTRSLAIQLAVSLTVVMLAAGVVIWIVVGAPLRQLTHAAGRMGVEDITPLLEPEAMEDELRLLAKALLGTDAELRTLVQGLEDQVRELDKAYTSLRQGEERFRAIFESVNDAILAVEIETGRIVDANPHFLEMFGCQPEMLGKIYVSQLSASSDFRALRFTLRALRQVRTQGPQMMEWRVRALNGREFWAEVNLRLARLGGVERMLVTLRDVDQRRRDSQAQMAVYRIAQAALVTGTLYEYFSLTHEILHSLLASQSFMAIFYDAENDLLTYPYHLDSRQAWPASQHLQEVPWLRPVLNQGQPLLLTPETARRQGLAAPDTSFAEWMAAPLTTSRGVLGALVLGNYDPARQWGQPELETFSFFTAQIAISVERKLAEDALRQSEVRWRALMESAPQLIMTLNREGRILFVNHPIPDLMARQEPGGSLFDFLPRLPEHPPEHLLAEVFNRRQSLTFDCSLPSANAEMRWFSCTLTPVIDRGWVEQAIFNAVEITRLKQAESALRASQEMYRGIVAQLTDGFALLDEKGCVLEWNAALEGMTDLPRPQALGKSIWDLQNRLNLMSPASISEEEQRKILQRYLSAFPTQARRQPHAVTLRDPQGQPIHIQQIIFPIQTPNGSRIGALFRDVTSERLAQQQVESLNEDLERRVQERTAELKATNQELESFSYSISHDLRAPLRAIDGFSRFLFEELGDNPPGEAARFLSIIRKNAQQMGQLIDDLLTFSRLHRQPINLQTVNPAEIIQHALEVLSIETENRSLDLQIDPALPSCQADPAFLTQVWTNLLSNALKFSRTRPISRIEIGFIPGETETTYFIRDNGAGFDMRYSNKLFGVFQRLHRTEEFEGTGVGLAIVERIIRRHQGRIWAESQPDAGATFFFTLPCVPQKDV